MSKFNPLLLTLGLMALTFGVGIGLGERQATLDPIQVEMNERNRLTAIAYIKAMKVMGEKCEEVMDREIDRKWVNPQ